MTTTQKELLRAAVAAKVRADRGVRIIREIIKKKTERIFEIKIANNQNP